PHRTELGKYLMDAFELGMGAVPFAVRYLVQIWLVLLSQVGQAGVVLVPHLWDRVGASVGSDADGNPESELPGGQVRSPGSARLLARRLSRPAYAVVSRRKLLELMDGSADSVLLWWGRRAQTHLPVDYVEAHFGPADVSAVAL